MDPLINMSSVASSPTQTPRNGSPRGSVSSGNYSVNIIDNHSDHDDSKRIQEKVTFLSKEVKILL